MWTVEVEQKQHLESIDRDISVRIDGAFEDIEEAREFSTLLLKGFNRTTVTIVYTESNFEEKEETKE